MNMDDSAHRFVHAEELAMNILEALEGDNVPAWPYLLLIKGEPSPSEAMQIIAAVLFGAETEQPPMVTNTLAEATKQAIIFARDMSPHTLDSSTYLVSDLSRYVEHGPVPMAEFSLASAVAAVMAAEGECSTEDIEQGVPTEWADEYGSGNGQGGYL